MSRPHTPDTSRDHGEHDAPHQSPVTAADDQRDAHGPAAVDKRGSANLDQDVVSASDDAAHSAATVLPLAEEELHVDKRETVTGRVRIRTVTDTFQENVQRELASERVAIERVPIGRYVEDGAVPGIRMEENTMIVPIMHEVLVVEKRLFVKEELRITRHTEHVTAEAPVTLRTQRAVIERLAGSGRKEQPNQE